MLNIRKYGVIDKVNKCRPCLKDLKNTRLGIEELGTFNRHFRRNKMSFSLIKYVENVFDNR